MNIPHDKFCVLPWISLETSPIGTVRPCCLAEEEITDNAGDKFNLATAQFSTIQNSQYMRNLRQEFIDKKQPATCRKCFREERSGRTSKRMHTLDRLKHIIPPQDWTIDSKPLRFLDLKLGNICNLKCRICGSWSSSTFATEELQFIRIHEDPKDNHHYRMLKQGAWPRENPTFWEEIEKVSGQIQYIEFTGGEPFMIKEHFNMLKRLVDRNIAGGIEIHYNTNGTQWPEHAEDIWRHFKLVEIAISIDDVGTRFEYQRSNAKWDEVLANIERFKSLRDRNTNIQLQFCCTINVFNVYYLKELADFVYAQGFNFVYWNMMHEAYYFSISTLPETAKQAITEHLRSAEVVDHARQEFARIIDFMNNGVGLDGNILRMRVADLDRKRTQNLAQVEPEFAQLIGYNGP